MASSSIKKPATLSVKRVLQADDSTPFQVDLKKSKEISEENMDTPKVFADPINLVPAKEVVYVTNLSAETEIPDILGFFKDVGKVVRVQLTVNHEGKHVGHGFVQFASSDEAKKALQMKNGEYLHGRMMRLEEANKMAPPPKFSIDHKFWYEEDYIQRESLNEAVEGPLETPDFVEKVLFVANLSPQTEIFDLVDFFEDVAEVVSVRLIINHKGRHVGYAFVQFASSDEARKALNIKNQVYLHDHRIFLDAAKSPYTPQAKYNLADKLCYEDYLRREKILTVEGLDKTLDFVEAVDVRKKTIGANLSPRTEIADIIEFFKNVGNVVHVRRLLTLKGKYGGYGFVEFASASEAMEALQKKNGEYLHGRMMRLEEANKIAPPPKYCLDHMVWYEDYLRGEGLLIQEEEAVTTSDFAETVSLRSKTLFVANLPSESEISNIVHFFKDVGEIVHIRLVVNCTGKHVGCCFVEFASASEAEKALEMKNWNQKCKIFLDVVKTAPYPLRLKFNYAQQIWCTPSFFQRASSEELDQSPNVVEVPVQLDETPDGESMLLYIANLPYGAEIPEIIDFFKDIGEVVHVRLVLSHKGKHVGYGFVEFASADEAKKALETKNGVKMQGRAIVLQMAKETCTPQKHRIGHKVWYREDYLLKKPEMETKPKHEKALMEEVLASLGERRR